MIESKHHPHTFKIMNQTTTIYQTKDVIGGSSKNDATATFLDHVGTHFSQEMLHHLMSDPLNHGRYLLLAASSI